MSDKNLNNPPAFPHFKIDEDGKPFVDTNMTGMTLRDYLAAKAMQSIIAKHGILDNLKHYHDAMVIQTVKVSYEVADAMIKERDNKNKQL